MFWKNGDPIQTEGERSEVPAAQIEEATPEPPPPPKVPYYEFTYWFAGPNLPQQKYDSDPCDTKAAAAKLREDVGDAFKRAMTQNSIEMIEKNLLIRGSELSWAFIGYVREEL